MSRPFTFICFQILKYIINSEVLHQVLCTRHTGLTTCVALAPAASVILHFVATSMLPHTPFNSNAGMPGDGWHPTSPCFELFARWRCSSVAAGMGNYSATSPTMASAACRFTDRTHMGACRRGCIHACKRAPSSSARAAPRVVSAVAPPLNCLVCKASVLDRLLEKTNTIRKSSSGEMQADRARLR